jgi:hypothetical protein
MAIVRIPISKFVAYMAWCLENKCGYIMGAYGQDPTKWAKDSWWFTQYTGEQRKKALYWRGHAPLVMDCNGLVEGGYQQETGVNINARARNNYSSWCNPKGTGKIPAAHRVPGAAVFIHNGSYVSHVGFLWKPVTCGKPEGDWWVIEARGVMYGVVATKMSERGWNRWGLMTKYFDYSDVGSSDEPSCEFGHRELSKGDSGADVKALQEALISLGFSCGKWGADGEFGKATKSAVIAFQTANNLVADGVVGNKTVAAINALLPESGEESEAPADPETAKPQVTVTGGSVYLRTLPSASSAIRGVVHQGDLLESAGESVSGWFPVVRDDEVCYISGKYAESAVG